MNWSMTSKFHKGFTFTDYLSLLDACIRSKSLFQGKLIHQNLIKTPNSSRQHFDFNLIHEKLTHLYAACKEFKFARQVFDRSPQKPKNVLVWNLLIRAYAWDGPFDKALNLYYYMLELGVQPSKYTFPIVLKACSALQAVEDGREIHFHAKRIGLDRDVYVSTALVDMYAKCGSLDDAEKVFDEMPKRDVVAWNSMIAGFSLHGGYYDETVQLILGMQSDLITPNSSTIVAFLPAIARASALIHGKEIHGFCVRRGYGHATDVVLATGLLDMYGKCQHIAYARRVFDTMNATKNEITWTAMFGAYVMCDYMRDALELFQKMMRQAINPTPVTLANVLRACGKLIDVCGGRFVHCYSIKSGFISDLMLGNTLLSTYAKCGIVDDAVKFFYDMDITDAVSYAAIISGCVQNGNAKEAMHMFWRFRFSGEEPQSTTMVGVFPACAHLAALQHGLCNHAYAIIHGFTTDITVGNALIDMYAKCGRLDMARRVFDTMLKQDIVSWNTVILAYGIHGLGKEAVLLFKDLLAEDLEPDDVTFVSLLSACGHSGLVDEGRHWFNAMCSDFNITLRIEHYMCMVDLLSRAGKFEDVLSFIEKMPFEPDVRIWGSLLAACKVYKNVKLGEYVSKKIEFLGHQSAGNFVLLSNMYSTVGRWSDAAQVRTMLRDQGLKKIPGCSWIEIGGVVHAFVGGDISHPLYLQVKRKIDELVLEMKKLGYQGESSYVFQDVEEEEKEQILLYHSEKLAIVLGILSLSPNKSILVTKNLRVCGDCHSAIKLISLITKRSIIVRDASRFHHFKDGSCNCRDFW